jgi:hypothetical protein
MRATRPAHHILDLITLLIFSDASSYYEASHYAVFSSLLPLPPSSSSSSFLGTTAQLRPWPPPQNPAEFLGDFSTIFSFTE